MNTIEISPIKRIEGEVYLKGDKSISHRAVMIGSIACGKTRIRNFLESEDCLHTIKAFRHLGISIDVSKDEVAIEGRGLNGLSKFSGEIYLGNSGTSMRLIAGILAGQNFESILTGDDSLSRRPMYRIIEPLRLMGAEIKGRDDNYAPLIIKGGKLKSIKYKTKVPSAQVKSAVILAGLYADGVTEIDEPIKSRDHTERMLSLYGARLRIEGTKVCVHNRPHLSLKNKVLTIPGDISAAAFFIIGSTILKNSQLVVKDLLFNRTRMGLIDILIEMGADIHIENKRFIGYEEICDIVVKASPIKGIIIERERIPSVIDELPILMVAACFAQGNTLIKEAKELRVKETDRIVSMVTALKKMGCRIEAKGDDILIEGSNHLRGATLDSYGDHRTAMSLVIAACCAEGSSQIRGIECISTSFPDFFKILNKICVK